MLEFDLGRVISQVQRLEIREQRPREPGYRQPFCRRRRLDDNIPAGVFDGVGEVERAQPVELVGTDVDGGATMAGESSHPFDRGGIVASVQSHHEDDGRQREDADQGGDTGAQEHGSQRCSIIRIQERRSKGREW